MSTDGTDSVVAHRHRRHANPFSLPAMTAAPAYPASMRRTVPWALDVGCGTGQFTAQMARANPQWNVVGLEMRPHLVEQTNKRLAAVGASGATAQLCNASVDLAHLVPPRSVIVVTVNFPDPWYKKRHQKRRVVCQPWLSRLVPLLQPGASLHMMTDFLPLAEAMREAAGQTAELVADPCCQPWAPTSTTGWSSEREDKHQARAQPIWRMLYRFVGP